jgi:putative protease
MEILSPAGNYESLVMALNSGADAVYLGLSDFSARKKAGNFTRKELENAVRLCRVSSVKVYAAINTLVHDKELVQVKEALEFVAALGLDAVIVQDLGVANLARTISKTVPKLKLHASTQMSVSSAGGAKFLSTIGFSRVVLARELSRNEIAAIAEAVPEIELEVFVHGALCVSLSGQCLMSAAFGDGERTANRGLCAQPCRLNFTRETSEYVLSLKDLSIIKHIPELEKSGVVSAKIEGRMRRPEYVAAVTDACVKAKNGDVYDENTLRAIFARGGSFTDGYYNGNMHGMQGYRTREDVVAGESVLSEIRNRFAKPFKRRKIDFGLVVTKEKIVCTGVCDGCKTETVFPPPESASVHGLTEEFARTQLSKLGGTVFYAGNITLTTDEGLYVSAKTLNEIRRTIVRNIETLS